jgi:hypothetical protein
MIRDKYLVDAKGLNIVRGEPIKVSRLLEEITKILKEA